MPCLLQGLSVQPALAQPPGITLNSGTSASCPTDGQFSLTRPDPPGVATQVGAAIFVNDITALDDLAQSFTTDLYLVLQWTDPRLADPTRGQSQAVCRLPLERVWSPTV